MPIGTVVPIARPQVGQEEKDALCAVLDSGMLAQGEQVREFEERFAAMCGVEHAVATSSGTAALYVALLAHGIGEGDEVITTPFTFIATANSILFAGARPVFVDIEEASFNLDPDLIEARIASRTRALMPVHLYGNPCDMDAIMRIADRYGLVVIEDACQAHGASVGGRRTGSFGTGCFSFYPTKNMTTGEGGMISAHDAEVAARARQLRDHGTASRYRHETLGFNFRMTDLQAALGLVQLRKLEVANEQRIANAGYLSAHLKGVEVPQVRPGCRHVYNQYTIRVKGDRDALIEGLRERGIGSRVYYPRLVPEQPVYRRLGYTGRFPVAERACHEVLSLPVHPSVSEEDLAYVVQAVNELTQR